MLEKIAGIDFLAKEVCYHAICRTQYQSLAEKVRKSLACEKYVWHASRKVHVKAFKEICSIVEESIIEKSEVSFLTDLTSLYRSILVDKGIDEDILFTCQHLQDKLARHFAGRILFDNGNKR